MRKCPFCAEEIQDEAIKCKHCGEWLQEKPTSETPSFSDSVKDSASQEIVDELPDIEEISETDDRNACPDGACIGVINEEGICTECGRTSEETKRGVASKATIIEEKEYIPLKQKSRWGWGWLVLLGLIVPAFQKTSYYSTPVTILIVPFGLVLLFAFYFWLRNRLIRRRTYDDKVWPSSLTAGFVTYVLCLLLIGVTLFVGRIQLNHDIAAFMQDFLPKVEKLKHEELKLAEAFVSEPTTEEDVRRNSELLNKSVVLIKKKSMVYKAYFDFVGKICERKNDKKLSEDFSELLNLHHENYNLALQSIQVLKECYRTGDENLWKKYEKISWERESIEKKYLKMIRDFSKKISRHYLA